MNVYNNPRTCSLSKVFKCSAVQEAGCIEMQIVGVVGYWFETQKKKEKNMTRDKFKKMRKGCIYKGSKLKMYHTNKTKMHWKYKQFTSFDWQQSMCWQKCTNNGSLSATHWTFAA